MINFLLDLLRLLYNVFPLFFTLAVFAGLGILLSKSIKKHSRVYYCLFALPFLLMLVPFFLGKLGIDVPRMNGLPVLSYFMRDYVHMGTLGFPLLIIIMYIGALDTRNRFVARLMSIRKELSIIAGFPVLTHATIRAFGVFPRGVSFFFDHEAYVAEHPVSSMAGAVISNFVFVLGIVMLALFLVLWVTSFTAVHRRMGSRRWRKVQRWAYALYVMLFIHSMGIQIGGMLTRQARDAEKPVAMAENAPAQHEGNNRTGGRTAHAAFGPQAGNDNVHGKSRKASEGNKRQDEHNGQREGGREQSGKQDERKRGGLDLAEIKPGRNAKSWIHIVSVCMVFGSYLVLRVRKARR